MSRPSTPILSGMYPDPSVCRVDGTYYLVNSTFEYLPGIPIHASDNLQDWRLVGHAVRDASQFDYSAVDDSRGMFAPTLRHHEGAFYLVCTQMDAGEVSGNFYMTAMDVAGPWSAPTMLPDARGIDPSIFFHDGRVWWVGCREVAEQSFEGETEVWMQELDLERGVLVGEERVIWTRTQYRAVWAEAPHLYERNGWFYLVTAEGGTAFEHSVMVARSRDVHGPYLPCPRNPVLTHRHLGHGAEVQSVGHADLFEGDEGEWWMVMLAVRPIDGHHVLGRETHLTAVVWEDDWPVVNPGLGVLDAPATSPGAWSSGNAAPSPDDFLTVRGFADFAEPSVAGLLLRSTGDGVTSHRHAAALLRRVTSVESEMTVTLDQLDASVTAGLLLRQSDDVSVRIAVTSDAGGLSVALICRNGADEVLATASLATGPVTLRAALGRDGVTFSASAADGHAVDLGSAPLSAVSTETAGGFVGATFGPFAEGPTGSSVLFTAWSQANHS